MFETAIEKAALYTRAIHTLERTLDSKQVHPGAATLFFINAEGWALTCKHVADLILAADPINTRYDHYKREVAALVQSGNEEHLAKREIQKKWDFNESTVVQLKLLFVDCIQGGLNVQIIRHDQYDLALIKFNDCKVAISEFPLFPRDTSQLKPGKILCRLGYPFPEFNNFQYNPERDDIEWTPFGNKVSPRFPLEGMVTRMVAEFNEGILSTIGFELSTPGLRGQSGGPVVDSSGMIWGIQSQTVHLPLGMPIRSQEHAYFHVGRCIHVELIKKFLEVNSVTYSEQSLKHD